MNSSHSLSVELGAVRPAMPTARRAAACAADLPRGVARASADALRVQRGVALAVMIVPFVGALVAAREVLAGRAGWIELALFVAMYAVHMGGVTMGLHRMVAHRAFVAHPVLRTLLVVMGSMAAQGPVLFWVSTHRRHHAYSDEVGDPHSPNLAGEGRLARLKGLVHAHMPWMLSGEQSQWSYFARDVLQDRMMFTLHRLYPVWVVLGLALPAAIGGLAHGTWAGVWLGLLFGGLARMFFANQAAWCVGSVCHMFGRAPFRTHDQSKNSWWVAALTFGEGLQNNHHAFPSSYRHAVEWWEPDLSGSAIAALARLGLCSELCAPSPRTIARMRKKAA